MKKVLLVTLLISLFYVACRKQSATTDSPGMNLSKAATGKGKLIPQRMLNLDATELQRLILRFKAAGGNAKLPELEPELETDYAVSVLEATLNYDFDAECSENYETYLKEVSFTVPLIPGTSSVTREAVEQVYNNFTAAIQEELNNGAQVLAANIEAYYPVTGEGDVVFSGSLSLFKVSNLFTCGGVPANFGLSVPSAFFAMAASPSCTITVGQNGYPDARSKLQSLINCKDFQDRTCLYGFYFFPITSYTNNGSPASGVYVNGNYTLYSSGFQNTNYFCNTNNYLTPTTVNLFRTNINTMAQANNPTPGYYEITNKFLWDSFTTNASGQKSVYWWLYVEYGHRNCKGPIPY